MPLHVGSWLVLLALPPVLAWFWWMHRVSITDLPRGRKLAAFLLRSMAAIFLVFAAASTRLVHRGASLAVMFVVDGSRSMPASAGAWATQYIAAARSRMHPGDRVGLVTFASEPHTQASPGDQADLTKVSDPGGTTSTNIAQALRQARIELDTAAAGSGKRIVLLSDGNENIGRGLAEVPDLAADGVVVDTLTPPFPSRPEALVDSLAMPSRVRIGEPFELRAVIRTNTAERGVVTLFRNGQPAGASRSIDLAIGTNVVTFEQTIDKAGFFNFAVDLEAPRDTVAANNRGEASVWVRGKPTVLYVADSPTLTAFLQAALRSESINVVYMPPAGLPSTAAGLEQFDSVFLSNVRADLLTDRQFSALQSACRDFGVGFGMVGGLDSFGAGGYRSTPIEDMLPVSLEVKKQRRIPSTAVALVIEDLEIPTTVNMSIEAAKATIDLLEPMDQVGVLDCNGGMFGNAGGPAGSWRIPMQHATDREALKAQMSQLHDMGDPPSYDPFLAEAARVLNGTDAKVKHIIFLGDGDAVYEQTQGATAALVHRIRDMGITLSTITTGATGRNDVQFMAAMAFAGGGAAYEAERPQELPRLLLKDQQTFSQPPIVEEPFRPQPVDGDEVFKGIDWGSAPPLLGYNVSNIKPSADLSLISHRQDPVFAGWRYGLGRSVAFLSDDRSRWAAQWIGWPGYSKFWAQAVRWTLRPSRQDDYVTQVRLEDGRGHISVDAVDDAGRFVNGLTLRARVAPPGSGATTAEASVRQTGPGHYDGWFDASDTGTYLVNVVTEGLAGRVASSSAVGLSIPYSPEYRDLKPDTYLMHRLAEEAGGRPDPAAAAVFGSDRPPVYSERDLSAMLVALALVLFLADTCVRRLAISREDAARAVAWLRGKRSGIREPERETRLEQLRAARDAAVGSRRVRGEPPVWAPGHHVAAPIAVEEAEPTATADQAPDAVDTEGVSALARLKEAKRRAAAVASRGASSGDEAPDEDAD